MDDPDFQNEMKRIFLSEAEEMLEVMEQSLLSLEEQGVSQSLLNQLFRIEHNLKGSSNAVGFFDLGHMAHEIENILSLAKDGKCELEDQIISLLFKCTDMMNQMIGEYRHNFDATFDINTYLKDLQEIQFAIEGGAKVPETSEERPGFELFDAGSETPASQDIRADEALAAPKPVAAPKVKDPDAKAVPKEAAPATPAPNQKVDETIRVNLSRISTLIDYIGELTITQSVLREKIKSVSDMEVTKVSEQLAKDTKVIQDISISLRMVPISPIFRKLQRIVRDVSSSLGKKVDCVVEGQDTEVDKTIYDLINDPLVHLLRNSVDHGIEHVSEREEAGKPPAGRITLGVTHRDGKLIFYVKDDGKGLDPDRIRGLAVERGIITPEADLSKSQIYQLIFAAGFSTKDEVSTISGRGVGMDVVKSNVENLGGKIDIASQKNVGTEMTITLPLSLSIIDGMVVRSGADRYIVPLNQVHESIRLNSHKIEERQGIGEILMFRDENLPLYHLHHLLGRHLKDRGLPDQPAIICRNESECFVVAVDEIIAKQQIFTKPVGYELQHLKQFSGSTILGDGKPALILELANLVESRTDGNYRRMAS